MCLDIYTTKQKLENWLMCFERVKSFVAHLVLSLY